MLNWRIPQNGPNVRIKLHGWFCKFKGLLNWIKELKFWVNVFSIAIYGNFAGLINTWRKAMIIIGMFFEIIFMRKLYSFKLRINFIVSFTSIVSDLGNIFNCNALLRYISFHNWHHRVQVWAPDFFPSSLISHSISGVTLVTIILLALVYYAH